MNYNYEERKFYIGQKEKYLRNLRNFKGFNEVDIDKCNSYVEKFNEEIEKTDDDSYYLFLLTRLNYYISKRNFSLAESIYILVNYIDPELDIIKIYETYCKKNEIVDEIEKEFGFYDQIIVKIEKVYISKYKNSDDYLFEKNLELKHIMTDLEEDIV